MQSIDTVAIDNTPINALPQLWCKAPTRHGFEGDAKGHGDGRTFVAGGDIALDLGLTQWVART